MQSVSSRIWTRVVVSISNDDNHYTTGNLCRYYLIPYNSLADVVRLLAELADTKSNVKLGGFRSQLQAPYVSSPTEEL